MLRSGRFTASAPAAIAAVCLASLLETVAAGKAGDGVALLQSNLEVSRSDAFKSTAQQPYRQRLVNVRDAQYLAYMQVGGQIISGLVDTSCSDMLVFSKGCRGCGHSMAAYDPKLSQNHSGASLRIEHKHSSGVTYSEEVWDEVQLGNFSANVAPFWMVTRAEMGFESAGFESILGLGPPELAEAEAWLNVKDQVDGANEAMDDDRMPTDAMLRAVSTRLASAKEVDAMQSTLGVLGEGTFSLCFGRAPGSDGFVVWGDDQHRKNPDLFRRIPVLRTNTWSVNMTGIRMERKGTDAQADRASSGAFELVCADGCVGTVVSSTPLLELPHWMLSAITAFTGVVTQEPCSNQLAQLPDLVFEVGTVTVTLPPTAYVSRSESECSLLLAASKDDSSITLGAPFMREYYTTFAVGDDHTDRALFIAAASEQCEPMAAGESATARAS